MNEIYILCKGYHDRAFWAGLLQYLGCKIPNGPIKLDPWDIPVRGNGEYAYLSKSDQFIRIVPVNGKTNMLPLAKQRLRLRSQKHLRRLILNVDSDQNADGTPTTQMGVSQESVLNLAREFDGNAAIVHNEIVIDSNTLPISLVTWSTQHPPVRGVPNQQTLERLLSVAICIAYPDRAEPVQKWLDTRPAPPLVNPKEHAWSFLAGWYSSMGSYEAFCSAIWKDSVLIPHLENVLKQTDAWRIATSIVE